MRDARQVVEQVARTAYGRLLAWLGAQTRDVAAAEDALGDALLEALANWPDDGVPDQPESWLLTAARHRLVDRQRRTRTRERHADALRARLLEAGAAQAAAGLPDERLRLFFVCAHPAIDAAVHAPLMLQLVLGIDAARIAPAFLVSPAAMQQRLVRAKTKIRATAIVFEVPGDDELPQRLAPVLEAIYAAYGLGWDGLPGADPAARELADEAVWLARVLAQHLPDEPEVRGLLALLLFCESRRAARRTGDGGYVPLAEQDTAQWDEAAIDEAEAQLVAAAQRGRHRGRFQLEAAIQSVHADRRRTGCTDHAAIAMFYAHLVDLAPTLAAQIGHAVAVGETSGAAAGLALLDAIALSDVRSHQPYWAARAHLAQRLGRADNAARAFELAIGLAQDEAVRRFLLARRG